MANLRADNLTGTGGRNAIDGSVFFDGESSYLTMPDSEDFNIGSSDFTIELWMYKNDTSTYQHIFRQRDSGSAEMAIVLDIDSTGSDSFASGYFQMEWGANKKFVGVNAGLTNNTWHHLALTKEGTTGRVFVNGVLVGTDTLDDIGNYSGDFYVGYWVGGLGYYFKGYISNFRICKGHAIYTANFTPPTQKLDLHAESVLLCCQDSNNGLQEATGKTITGYGRYANTDTELVTNHSFNNGTTGWTLSDASEGSMAVTNGSLVLTNDDSSDPPVYAWQAVTLVVGQTYDLKVHFSGGTGTPGSNLAIYLNTSSSFGSSAGGSMTADSVSGNGIKIHRFKATVATTYLLLRVNANAAGTSIFSAASIKASDYGKAPKFLPPVGIDEGVVVDGYTKINSPGVMYFPTGDTSQRGRGRALFGGGSTVINTIQYLNIQSQGNAQDFGDLSAGRYETECASSSTRGVWGGGYIESPNVKVDTIEYVTIATTSNTTDFGNLTVARGHLAGVCNSTRGVFVNGTTNPSPHPVVNTIDYITTATTGNATDFGDTTTASKPMGGGRSSTTRGVFTLGNAPSAVNTMEYVTIASTGNSADFGDAIVSGWGRGAGNISSGTRGILGGGNPALNTIEYITIASLGNGTDFGDLVVGRRSAYSAGSTVRGVFGGGKTPTQLNSIEYITIASTGNAADFGDLINSKSFASGLSDCHGGLS